MIYVSIFAFALALTACGCAVPALITSLRQTSARERWQLRIESDLTRHAQRIESESAKVSAALLELQRATPTKLAAEVAALAGALDTLAAQHRKLSGQFHATKTPAPRAVANGDTVEDDELAAVLALQTAKTPAPSH